MRRTALLAVALAAGGCSRQAAPSAEEQALAAEQRATERKALDDVRAAQAAVPARPTAEENAHAEAGEAP